MTRASRTLYLLFHAAVFLAGSALLAWWFPALNASDPSLLIVGFLLATLAEASAIALPGGGRFSPAALVAIGLLMIGGPAAAAWPLALAIVVVQGVWRRRPLLRVGLNLSIAALAAAAGATVLQLLDVQAPRLDHLTDFAGGLAAAAAHGLTTTMIVASALALEDGTSPLTIWRRTLRTSAGHHVMLLVSGVLLAAVYREVGVWALVLVGLPSALAYRSFRRWVELRSDLKDFVRALSEVLDEVDPYTRQHSVRVSHYSMRLGRAFGLAERDLEDLECAALVHDLGKIGPQHQHILQKSGRLSAEEQRTMQGHPHAGASIVRKVRTLRRAAEIVAKHHERPDGAGYPIGLTTPEIPVPARILNVADAFDAMTSDRPYRRALDPIMAIRELERGSGTQFDSDAVRCLVRLWGQGRFSLIPSPSSEELLALRVRAGRASA
ncbi:MAG: HD-GYP domain-containing protein [Candidatus Eisenbacteria bacterium]|uniref:HD-GYP domain-containing protein n=1 Tax=Eiseniibacteriota bacterium TaxID=2212470 RepID=A0A849SK24_UNCEI|nr:HD-GYP domain-containing protein [Candidatus Eisenbacteria bacterium]